MCVCVCVCVCVCMVGSVGGLVGKKGRGGRPVLIGTEDRGQEERRRRGVQERQGVLKPSGGSLCLMMRLSRN